MMKKYYFNNPKGKFILKLQLNVFLQQIAVILQHEPNYKTTANELPFVGALDDASLESLWH